MKALTLCIIVALNALVSFSQSPQILVPFRAKNKWGYSDTLGHIKIQPKYDTVSLFDYDMIHKGNHVIAIVKFQGKSMVINESAAIIVPPRYDYIRIEEDIDEPTFLISKNNKFGLFTKGKELFPPVCDYIVDYSYEGLFQIQQMGKCGLIDITGKVLIPIIYDHVDRVNYYDLSKTREQQPGYNWQATIWGKAPVYYVIKPVNISTLSQVPPKEMLLSDFIPKEELNKAIESVKGQYSFDSIQLKNNAAVLYQGALPGILFPKEEKKVYFFSKPYSIHSIKYFFPGARNSLNKNSTAYIISSLNGKYGMINEREDVVLPFNYDTIEEKDEFFLLKQNGKIGFFIWNTVHPVIQPAYDEYLWKQYIPVNNGWRFTLFKVVQKGRAFFVGENGVAYFRD